MTDSTLRGPPRTGAAARPAASQQEQGGGAVHSRRAHKANSAADRAPSAFRAPARGLESRRGIGRRLCGPGSGIRPAVPGPVGVFAMVFRAPWVDTAGARQLRAGAGPAARRRWLGAGRRSADAAPVTCCSCFGLVGTNLTKGAALPTAPVPARTPWAAPAAAQRSAAAHFRGTCPPPAPRVLRAAEHPTRGFPFLSAATTPLLQPLPPPTPTLLLASRPPPPARPGPCRSPSPPCAESATSRGSSLPTPHSASPSRASATRRPPASLPTPLSPCPPPPPPRPPSSPSLSSPPPAVPHHTPAILRPHANNTLHRPPHPHLFTHQPRLRLPPHPP